jgi:hypothetical protein
MSIWHGDWANRQEPVYGRDGEVVGCVAANGPHWVATDLDGRQVTTWSTRRQAEQEVLRVARANQVQQHHPARHQLAPRSAPQADVSLDQVAGAMAAGAALLGALGAFIGGQQGQPGQADELRRQNDELRQQNELLRQALNQVGPKGLARRK